MELTDTEMHLLARLSRDRRLYAECKGADLDALEKVGLLQWFDARSSTTPFKERSAPTVQIASIQRQDRLFLGCTCRKLARACRARSLRQG